MAKVIQVQTVEEFDEDPGQAGKRKVVRIQTVGEQSTTKGD